MTNLNTDTSGRDGDCPTVGADARELARFAAVETDAGDLLIYDEDEEAAWLQSDVYYSLATGQ